LDRPVPHPTTLVKLVRRAGPETIEQLNAALVAKLAQDKLLRGRKLRVDTTVVEADIDYPTDADLLEQAVSKLGGLVRRVKGRGAASRTRFRDRGRAAGRRMKRLARTLRRRTGVAMGEVDQLTGEVAQIARHTLKQVQAVAHNAGRAVRRRPGDGRLRRLVEELAETIAATGRLLAQTDQRLAGNRVIPDRLVSLADPDARPIRKGKPRQPTQFGYSLLVAEDERGFVADHQLQRGNPPDAPQLVPSVQRVVSRQPARKWRREQRPPTEASRLPHPRPLETSLRPRVRGARGRRADRAALDQPVARPMASHTECWGTTPDHRRNASDPAPSRCAAMAQHAKDAHEGGPQRRSLRRRGWRTPPMALLAARIVRATPSGCRTIRANRYSLTIRTSPSTVQAYQSSIPRMTQTALERTGKARDGAAPPKGRAGTGWR
jgi:hypothetical protein